MNPPTEETRLAAADLLERVLDADASGHDSGELWRRFEATYLPLDDPWVADVAYLYVHWTDRGRDGDCRNMIASLRRSGGRIR